MNDTINLWRAEIAAELEAARQRLSDAIVGLENAETAAIAAKAAHAGTEALIAQIAKHGGLATPLLHRWQDAQGEVGRAIGSIRPAQQMVESARRKVIEWDLALAQIDAAMRTEARDDEAVEDVAVMTTLGRGGGLQRPGARPAGDEQSPPADSPSEVEAVA